MERLGDMLDNYPLPRQPQQNGSGMSEQLSLDHLLGETGAPEPPGKDQGAARQQAKAARREAEQACPLCHGAGYLAQDLPVDDPNFGKIVPCTCKEKELKNKRRLELGRLARLDSHWDQTFDTFDHTVPGVQEAFKMARAYADDPQGWLVLSGPVGCGKTHLAAAVANVCLDRDHLVIFSTVPELLDHLRTAFAPSNEMPYHELFDRIREAYLLVLDDLGVEYSTPWATDKLFQLINYRYEYRMPTIVTTNSDLKSLDIRIQSRLSDISLVRRCHIKAQDYRPRNVPARHVRR
jgi:DNA replication protein DnaC